MNVLKITSDESCSVLQPVDAERSMQVMGTGGFTGTPMRASWETLAHHFEDASSHRTDFVALMSGALAFDGRALAEFSELFRSVGEILELNVNGEPYYALNVLRSVDALDLTRSGAKLYPHGTLRSLEQHVFLPEVVRAETIFRVPQLRTSLFVVAGLDRSRDFHRRYNEGGYTGLRFKGVWQA